MEVYLKINLSFCFSETIFISSLFLKDIFALYRIFFNHSIWFHYFSLPPAETKFLLRSWFSFLLLIMKDNISLSLGDFKIYSFHFILWDLVMFVLHVIFSVFVCMVYLFTLLNTWFDIYFYIWKIIFIISFKNCF